MGPPARQEGPGRQSYTQVGEPGRVGARCSFQAPGALRSRAGGRQSWPSLQTHDVDPEGARPHVGDDGRAERARRVDGAAIDRDEHQVAQEDGKADGNRRKAGVQAVLATHGLKDGEDQDAGHHRLAQHGVPGTHACAARRGEGQAAVLNGARRLHHRLHRRALTPPTATHWLALPCCGDSTPGLSLSAPRSLLAAPGMVPYSRPAAKMAPTIWATT